MYAMLEIDYEGTAVRAARSFARAPLPEEIDAMLNDDDEDARAYGRLRSNASVTKAERIDYLRTVTLAVVRPEAPPVLDEITISRELCKEILVALDHAAGFGAFIPRRIQNESVAEYAGSMRFDALNAAMRLRRAALSQEAA